MSVLVIIPTYNEKDNIIKLVDCIMKFNYDILFIDDNSPDGTAAIIENLSEKNNKIGLLKRERKSGLGSAYVEGFGYSIKNGYTRVIMMDADLSHPCEKIPELINCASNFVIGSRYMPEGRIEGWPLFRRILSKSANLYAAMILNIGVNDLTSGFNCIETKVLETIGYKDLKCEGYAFLIELKYLAFKKGFTMKEIPITFKEREHGESKISKSIIWEAFWLVLRLGWFF